MAFLWAHMGFNGLTWAFVGFYGLVWPVFLFFFKKGPAHTLHVRFGAACPSFFSWAGSGPGYVPLWTPGP